MNLSNLFSATSTVRTPATAVAAARAPRAARAYRRDRDFGVGYGNSSGYASDKRYTRDWGNARFRFA